MKFDVTLGDRGYEVRTGAGARRELAGLIASRAPRARTAAIVTSAGLVDQSWFDLDTGIDQHVVVVPDGETAKTMATVEYLCERFV